MKVYRYPARVYCSLNDLRAPPEQNFHCAIAGNCNTIAIRSIKGYLRSKDYIVAEGLQEELKLRVIFFARLSTNVNTIFNDAVVDAIKSLQKIFFLFYRKQQAMQVLWLT